MSVVPDFIQQLQGFFPGFQIRKDGENFVVCSNIEPNVKTLSRQLHAQYQIGQIVFPDTPKYVDYHLNCGKKEYYYVQLTPFDCQKLTDINKALIARGKNGLQINIKDFPPPSALDTLSATRSFSVVPGINTPTPAEPHGPSQIPDNGEGAFQIEACFNQRSGVNSRVIVRLRFRESFMDRHPELFAKYRADHLNDNGYTVTLDFPGSFRDSENRLQSFQPEIQDFFERMQRANAVITFHPFVDRKKHRREFCDPEFATQEKDTYGQLVFAADAIEIWPRGTQVQDILSGSAQSLGVLDTTELYADRVKTNLGTMLAAVEGSRP